jgi:hypothetical protein
VVGKRGFEPLSFSLSGSCSDLLSYMPADGGGPDPQRSRAQPGSSRRLPPGSFTIHVRRAENSNPSALAPGRFRGGARALAGSLSKAEDGDPDPQRVSAQPVSGRCRVPARFILHGGRRTTRKPQFPAHPLATEPGAPVRFTFRGYRPGDSNPDHPRPERGASAIGLGRLGADTGYRTRDLHLGKVALYP